MRSVIVLVLIVQLLAMTAHAGTSKTYGSIYNAEYVAAIDGNTIIMNLPGMHPLIGKQVEVRIRGIDVPNLNSHCEQERTLAKKARDIVASLLLKARVIHLENVGRDLRFRVTATVIADGKDVSDVLIKIGIATLTSQTRMNTDWCR
ncbi:MAG: thermonuclease family protein [Proteobacteria bacterium]|nr:thermonuclease family protein [Pseudomonadota bacterium]MBU1710356.1 thermonuclease family protein [Pseudomonadota bacterium]